MYRRLAEKNGGFRYFAADNSWSSAVSLLNWRLCGLHPPPAVIRRLVPQQFKIKMLRHA
jgi:hypothetical protein